MFRIYRKDKLFKRQRGPDGEVPLDISASGSAQTTFKFDAGERCAASNLVHPHMADTILGADFTVEVLLGETLTVIEAPLSLRTNVLTCYYVLSQALELAKLYQENAEEALKSIQNRMERLESVTSILRSAMVIGKPIAEVSGSGDI